MKNSWTELSQKEFITVSSLIRQFQKGELNLFEMRVRLTLILLGLDIRRMKIRGNEDTLNENIYHLTRELNFFFKIEYEDQKAFSHISAEVRKQLLHTSPEDLPQTPEIRAASKLKRHIRLNVEFGKNIIPELQIGRRHFPGYTFNVTDGIAQTSLTALQYSEAQKIIAQYAQNESSALLSLLCGILYQVGYSEEVAVDLARQFSVVEHAVKEAVLLNFMAVTNFIVKETKYRILFDRPKKSKKEQKYSLGLADNMYMLSKRGYGDSKLMENAGLFKFFDLLIKELSDQVAELKGAKKKLAEIAEIMNLTIEQVNDLL
jgi:hypothetical protein